MGSKMVVDRQKSAEAVMAAGRTHREMVAKTFGERFGVDAGPAVSLVMERMVATLEASVASMVAADDANLKELADDPAVIDARDTAVAETYDALVELRDVGSAVWGRAYMGRLGFDGSTPREATAVARLSRLVLDSVATIPPPPPKRPGLTLDVSSWVAPLENSTSRLENAVRELADERREAEATKLAKDEAMDAYNKTFSDTANLFTALFCAADKPDLADRVRPSVRRPGRTVEEAETITSEPTTE